MPNATTTAELFRLISLSIGKEKAATPYAVGKALGVAHTTALAWSRGYKTMDDENAQKAAEITGLDVDFVILSLEAERRHRAGMDKIAGIFERAAQAIQHHAASIFIGFFALAALPFLAHAVPELCILC